MILQIADGREIRLPDSWEDDDAREFGRQIMRGEIPASRLAELEREADAESSVHDLILFELREIKKVLLADRQMVQDPTTGEMSRSRVVIRR